MFDSYNLIGSYQKPKRYRYTPARAGNNYFARVAELTMFRETSKSKKDGQNDGYAKTEVNKQDSGEEAAENTDNMQQSKINNKSTMKGQTMKISSRLYRNNEISKEEEEKYAYMFVEEKPLKERVKPISDEVYGNLMKPMKYYPPEKKEESKEGEEGKNENNGEEGEEGNKEEAQGSGEGEGSGDEGKKEKKPYSPLDNPEVSRIPEIEVANYRKLIAPMRYDPPKKEENNGEEGEEYGEGGEEGEEGEKGNEDEGQEKKKDEKWKAESDIKQIDDEKYLSLCYGRNVPAYARKPKQEEEKEEEKKQDEGEEGEGEEADDNELVDVEIEEEVEKEVEVEDDEAPADPNKPMVLLVDWIKMDPEDNKDPNKPTKKVVQKVMEKKIIQKTKGQIRQEEKQKKEEEERAAREAAAAEQQNAEEGEGENKDDGKYDPKKNCKIPEIDEDKYNRLLGDKGDGKEGRFKTYKIKKEELEELEAIRKDYKLAIVPMKKPAKIDDGKYKSLCFGNKEPETINYADYEKKKPIDTVQKIDDAIYANLCKTKK